MRHETFQWPSIASFGLYWVVMSLVTWGLVCLLSLVFMRHELEAGLVPGAILLALVLMPISMVTVIVQTTLFLIGRSVWPDFDESNKWLVWLGTPLVTWLCLLLITFMLGGAGSLVPRI